MKSVLIRRGRETRDVCTQRRDSVRTEKERPGREDSPETNPSGTEIYFRLLVSRTVRK